MKDYSNFLGEKPFCNVEGNSMKFSNENNLVSNKRKHDMILNLGLGQKGSTYADQTPTPTQFIRNCEEVGLFQDLQNVNPFEETFKKAVEAVKSGQLSLEKSFQSASTDDTLHTPNVFPHITDVPNLTHSDISNKNENTQPCEDDLLKQDVLETDKNCLTNITTAKVIPQSGLKKENTALWNSSENLENKASESKSILNVPEGHLVQMLPPQNDSCNMVVIKNPAENLFSSESLSVKEKLKKSLSEKKAEKNIPQKVPILKCPTKKSSNSLTNKFSKFSKNAMRLISKLENSEATEVKTASKQKKLSKAQSKESRSEFLARSRAASFRCREKKKMYLLYLEKVNSDLSTANQNLLLINSLLRQEIDELHCELQKHKNCNAADKNTEAALKTAANFIGKKKMCEREETLEVRLQPEVNPKKCEVLTNVKQECFPLNNDFSDKIQETQTDDDCCITDVAEVILSDEPEENEIPLNEGNKPPNIIVRFNNVGNDFPTALPTNSHLDRCIERAGDKAKQIYGEHSYYLKKSSVNLDKRFMNYKAYREAIEKSSEKCKELNAFQIQNDAFRDLTSLNSKVLVTPRTPPPLILLKPFKKRTLLNKRNEKT